MKAQGNPHAGACDVPQDIIDRIVDVLGPADIWLFGSRARGDHRPDSDWDFLVVLPDHAPAESLDMVQAWGRLRDLRLRRVEVYPVRRAEFEEGRTCRGTLSQIVAVEGRLVHAA